MGRKPKSPAAIPRLRVRVKAGGKRWYYYDHGGKPRRETPLGSDYALAIKRWAELEGAARRRRCARPSPSATPVADRICS